MAGRDDVLLEPILRLLLKYVADPRFGVMVADIAGVVIGEICLSPDPSELILFLCFRYVQASYRSSSPC